MRFYCSFILRPVPKFLAKMRHEDAITQELESSENSEAWHSGWGTYTYLIHVLLSMTVSPFLQSSKYILLRFSLGDVL
jgi:hypothetical protein